MIIFWKTHHQKSNNRHEKIEVYGQLWFRCAFGRYKIISRRGGELGVVGINTQIDRIFVVSGLYKIIKAYDDLKQALNDTGGIDMDKINEMRLRFLPNPVIILCPRYYCRICFTNESNPGNKRHKNCHF